MFKQLVLTTALVAASTALFAAPRVATAQAKPNPQAQAAPQLTPEQKAAIEKQNSEIAQAALQVAQAIDQGKAGDVWDHASPIAQHAVARAVFVKSVDADRTTVGKVQERKLATITRNFSDGKTAATKGSQPLPFGYYINVFFATKFANEKQPVRELVSFHMDQDKQWRVSGYTLR